MAIDKSGKWWKGTNFDDLAEYIRLFTEEGYPADRVVQCVCTCGNKTFRLVADSDEGCAQRTCTVCNNSAFIFDSAEYWEDATPEKVQCLCKHKTFEIGVGFSLRPNEDVKWITVGQRCMKCGVLASYADWKVDYSPSAHLLSMA
jgi:hypothetical protein